jgi:putative Holliday junction resolvase
VFDASLRFSGGSVCFIYAVRYNRAHGYYSEIICGLSGGGAVVILAVDYGLKRTGIAVCDRSETIASPLAVLTDNGQALVRRICGFAEEYRAKAILLGLPLNMDGSEGPQAKLVRRFGDELAGTSGLDVLYHDERLSSDYAEHLMRGAELTRKKKKQRLDAVAAAAILQSYIDSHA